VVRFLARREDVRAGGRPVLGIVENMSYYVCPSCGERSELFLAGGGKRLAEELKVRCSVRCRCKRTWRTWPMKESQSSSPSPSPPAAVALKDVGAPRGGGSSPRAGGARPALVATLITLLTTSDADSYVGEMKGVRCRKYMRGPSRHHASGPTRRRPRGAVHPVAVCIAFPRKRFTSPSSIPEWAPIRRALAAAAAAITSWAPTTAAFIPAGGLAVRLAAHPDGAAPTSTARDVFAPAAAG